MNRFNPYRDIQQWVCVFVSNFSDKMQIDKFGEGPAEFEISEGKKTNILCLRFYLRQHYICYLYLFLIFQTNFKCQESYLFSL